MFDQVVISAFLRDQLKLYPEKVADNAQEAEEFLEEMCAAVADSAGDVADYLEDVGVDTEGLTQEEIMSMPEIIAVGDGRYLILEI